MMEWQIRRQEEAASRSWVWRIWWGSIVYASHTDTQFFQSLGTLHRSHTSVFFMLPLWWLLQKLGGGWRWGWTRSELSWAPKTWQRGGSARFQRNWRATPSVCRGASDGWAWVLLSLSHLMIALPLPQPVSPYTLIFPGATDRRNVHIGDAFNQRNNIPVFSDAFIHISNIS